jgi:sporulation protein YlmC with PRC-barrel domain
MIDQASVPSLMGSTVRDSAGEKIGKVGQVYLDDTTGQPEWVTVRTGLFGTKESFVPLAAARVEGDELVVDIPKSKVHDAPRIDEDGHLSEEQETELYTYYGVSQGPFGRQTPTDAGPDTAATGMTADTGMARGTGMAASTGTAAGLAAGEADPTGTPLGDQDVAQAMGGKGFVETGELGEEEGPDFARGEDESLTGTAGGLSGGPDFARGEDASVTGAPSTAAPDFARGSAVEADPVSPVGTRRTAGSAGTGGEAGRGRLRRWMVTDEQSTTPVVDETGQVIGEVSSERVDVRPLDEDGDETR